MSATVAIVAATSANNAAMAAAGAARRAECRSTLETYDAHTATVEQARDYASCVHLIHGSGEPMSDTTAMLLKFAIVLAFVGFGVVAKWSWDEDRDPLLSCMAGALGAMLFPCFLGALVLGWMGLQFLFS